MRLFINYHGWSKKLKTIHISNKPYSLFTQTLWLKLQGEVKEIDSDNIEISCAVATPFIEYGHSAQFYDSENSFPELMATHCTRSWNVLKMTLIGAGTKPWKLLLRSRLNACRKVRIYTKLVSKLSIFINSFWFIFSLRLPSQSRDITPRCRQKWRHNNLHKQRRRTSVSRARNRDHDIQIICRMNHIDGHKSHHSKLICDDAEGWKDDSNENLHLRADEMINVICVEKSKKTWITF